MINIYQPSLGKEELKAIKEVFESNWLGKGSKTDEFINRFSQKLILNIFDGVMFSHASPKNLLPISSCTEGLFQAVNLYVNEGDEVILPSINFIGAANAIIAKKAKPVFCDVDKRTLNVRLKDIEKKVTNSTKAIIVLHYGGVPCDIENIVEFCKIKGIKLIEDNANSPFSHVNNKSTGTFGDIGLWSFDSMKQVVMGDGGMIHCKNQEDIETLQQETYLGLLTQSGFSNSNDKWWEFDIDRPGRRAIINDIQAAMGLEQLKKIDKQILKRKKIHNTYSKELSDCVDVPLPLDSSKTSSYYMYHIQTPNRDKLASYLREKGIYTTFRYYPLHKVKYFKQYSTNLPNTEYIMKNTVCIPIHQSLTKKQVNYICETIKKFKQ